MISWVDQCVLNAVFNENVKYLDRKFNFQHHSGIDEIKNLYSKQKNDIVILHYVAQKKPWNFEKSIILVIEYLYYALKTPYRLEFCKNLTIAFCKKVRLLINIYT